MAILSMPGTDTRCRLLFRVGGLGNELEIAEDYFLIGGGRGFEAPQIHAQGNRNLRDARGIVWRSERERLQDIGGGAEGLQAAHDGTDDAGGGPLEARGGQRGTFGIVNEIVFHGAEGFVAGGGIESEVGIAAVTGIVPARELDIDFVFRVDTDSAFRSIVKQPENGGGIHLVDGAFDLPLVRSEAEILGGKDFGGGDSSIAIHDAQVQVTMRIDGNVRGIRFHHARNAAAADQPFATHPLQGVWLGPGGGGPERKKGNYGGKDKKKSDEGNFSRDRHGEFISQATPVLV